MPDLLKTLKLQVSQSRLAEWRAFLKRVGPTAQNPVPGDRVMTYARYGFDTAERVKAIKARARSAQKAAGAAQKNQVPTQKPAPAAHKTPLPPALQQEIAKRVALIRAESIESAQDVPENDPDGNSGLG